VATVRCIEWEDVIKKEVRSTNNADLGEDIGNMWIGEDLF
jgi:hypothetical protein